MKRFYIASDYELMVDTLKAEINFLKSSWQNLLGRPLVVLTLNQTYLGILLFYLHGLVYACFWHPFISSCCNLVFFKIYFDFTHLFLNVCITSFKSSFL